MAGRLTREHQRQHQLVTAAELDARLRHNPKTLHPVPGLKARPEYRRIRVRKHQHIHI